MLHPESQDLLLNPAGVAAIVVGDPESVPALHAAAEAVVAEAVALALEAAAAEAAEAVLVTASAVTEAAARAADAAQSAKEGRAFAAAAAAQSLALEAERSADRVRERADLTAARVERAAALAVDELTRCIEDGTVLDARQMIEVLAATVQGAAAAIDADTTLAARVVSDAESAAAIQVTQTLAAAEEFFGREVAAAVDTQRRLATAAAVAVSLETDARATHVALAAAGAAEALLANEALSHSVDQRAVLSAHELAVELSHDLRVPLSSIVASVEMIEDELRGRSDENVSTLLRSALRATDRMVRMLDEYMTPRAAGDSHVLPVVDLAEVVRRLVLDSANILVPVGAVVEAGPLPVVRAKADGMYSVLQNLLTNSVKFARPGVPARVRISASRSVDGWRISVRDNGVGLPEGTGLDVFSLFSRGTSTVTGHGIGLATVARVVAEHGGRVGVSASAIKPGAEIWFELPEDK